MFSKQVGPDLELILLLPHHANQLFRLARANREHLVDWLPWVEENKTLADVRAYLEHALQALARDGSLVCGITFEGQLAGSASLLFDGPAGRQAELHYWLARRYTGRGLVTQALQALIDHAFEERETRRLVILSPVGNQRSRAVAKRLGFKLDGVLRQHLWLRDRLVDTAVYSLLREEWEQERARGRPA